MKSYDKDVGNIFSERKRPFTVPPYQRSYSWKEENWQTLIDDIIYSKVTSTDHFLGTIVVLDKKKEQEVEVIDGQQRLTTLYILLTAIAHLHLEASNTQRALGIRDADLIFVKGRQQHEGLRLRLSNRKLQSDHDTLSKLVSYTEPKNPIPSFNSDSSSSIVDAYNHIKREIKKHCENSIDEYEAFYNAMSNLLLVVIELDEKENPQKIFRSINATGLRLTAADLIRNHVLMGLAQHEQEALYSSHWEQLDRIFPSSSSSKAAGTKFDEFIRFFIAIKRGQEPENRLTRKNLLCPINPIALYNTFCKELYDKKKQEVDDPYLAVDELMKECVIFAQDYQQVVDNEVYCKQNSITDLRKLDKDLQFHIKLHQSGFTPFLMELVAEVRNKQIAENEAIEAINVIEGYSARRSVSPKYKDTNNIYNDVGPILWRTTTDLLKGGGRFIDAFMMAFADLLSKSDRYHYPTDEETRSNLVEERGFYTINTSTAILLRMERQYKESGTAQETEIEHIMPQDRKHWPDVNDVDYSQFLNNIGNLTLMSKRGNAAVSNSQFTTKLEEYKKAAFQLTLRTGIVDKQQWGREEIIDRAEQMAKIFIDQWPCSPMLKEQIRIAREKQASTQKSSTLVKLAIEHPHLQEYTDKLLQAINEMGGKYEQKASTYLCERGASFVYLKPQVETLNVGFVGEPGKYATVTAHYALESPSDIRGKNTISSRCDWQIKLEWEHPQFHKAALEILKIALD